MARSVTSSSSSSFSQDSTLKKCLCLPSPKQSFNQPNAAKTKTSKLAQDIHDLEMDLQAPNHSKSDSLSESSNENKDIHPVQDILVADLLVNDTDNALDSLCTAVVSNK
eukprot:15357817-Ditylum_brightwellii.AAC.1